MTIHAGSVRLLNLSNGQVVEMFGEVAIATVDDTPIRRPWTDGLVTREIEIKTVSAAALRILFGGRVFRNGPQKLVADGHEYRRRRRTR